MATDSKIKLIVHKAEEGGYWAEVEGMPGCVTEGETIHELHQNIKEAVMGWLLASRGGPLWPPDTALVQGNK